MIAQSGADGLHTHKSSFEDLKELVDLAHKYGLTVDAYIGHPSDLYTFGIAAEIPEDVAAVAKKMEALGVDMIGLMMGMSYEGVIAGDIPEAIKQRLLALVVGTAIDNVGPLGALLPPNCGCLLISSVSGCLQENPNAKNFLCCLS